MNQPFFYPNLVPCRVDYPTCETVMTKVFELAPYDSNIRAFINVLSDGTYHTVIAINAIFGSFRSEGNKLSLVSSLQQAQRGMLTILADWKKGRVEI